MTARASHEAERHEFPFTPAHFERVRTMIYAHAGITLSTTRSAMVYNRLARNVRQLGLSGFDEYLAAVDRGGPDEHQAFTNALTTNLTSFFREAHHFPLLAEHLRRAGAQRPQTIWCAAASTGEEPYSLAMTAVEAFDQDKPPVRIIASDVDTNVLSTARAGIYGGERVETLEPHRLKRFFMRGRGGQDGQVKVRDALRSLVTFERVNLLDPRWPIEGSLDAIFCRNVMIYFDKPTQLKVLERFAPLLKPDGLLFMGHSESLHQAAHLFTLRGKTVYSVSKPGERK